MKHCKSCGNEIPEKRISLGYKTCVSCSTESRWSGIQVVHHKTGNETQIVKDPEVAAEFYAKSSRSGFGAMRGLTSSYKPKKIASPEIKPEKIPENKPLPVIVVTSRKMLPNDYEKVGEEVVSLALSGDKKSAMTVLEKSLAEKRIFPLHYRKLLAIVEELK